MTYPALYNLPALSSIPILHIKKLKLREVKQLTQYHTATKWKSQADHLQAALLITLLQ